MFTDIYKQFKLRKETNNTLTDILNMFWLEGSIEKEFFQDTIDSDFPLYFSHSENPYYF